MTLPRLDKHKTYFNPDGTPSLDFIVYWQRLLEAIEAADASNTALDETQQSALDALDDALTRATAAYELLGPGAYSITSSQTLPEDCRTALVNTSGGAVTVTLRPVASMVADVVVKKVSADANAVTIDGNGAETIDGAATVSFSTQYESRTIRPALGALHLI